MLAVKVEKVSSVIYKLSAKLEPKKDHLENIILIPDQFFKHVFCLTVMYGVMVEVMKNHKSFDFFFGEDVNNDFLLMNNQTQHSSKRRPQDTLSKQVPMFTLNPVVKTYCLVQQITFFASCDMLKYACLCVAHSVEWKEQTISFHPSGLGVAV